MDIQEVEKKFTKKLVLAVLDLDKKIRMEVVVLNYVTEEVLSIECEDKRWKLVAFLWKSLNETKRNYEIHNKKILAIIEGFEN